MPGFSRARGTNSGGGGLDDYVSWLQAWGASSGTIRLRIAHLSRFSAHASLFNATEDDIVSWLMQPGWKPQTRASYRSTLKSFYGWMVKTGRREDDPTANTRPIRTPHQVQPVATKQALDAALAAASDQDRLALLLAGYAGLRRAEIASLHSADIRQDHIVVMKGKGGKQRKVPIHDRLRPELMAAQARGGYVFPGAVSWEPVSADAMGRRLARAMNSKETGLTAHSLRRFFGTEVYRNSKDIRAVQVLLGHSSLATTQSYVGFSDEDLTAAVATLSA